MTQRSAPSYQPCFLKTVPLCVPPCTLHDVFSGWPSRYMLGSGNTTKVPILLIFAEHSNCAKRLSRLTTYRFDLISAHLTLSACLHSFSMNPFVLKLHHSATNPYIVRQITIRKQITLCAQAVTDRGIALTIHGHRNMGVYLP